MQLEKKKDQRYHNISPFSQSVESLSSIQPNYILVIVAGFKPTSPP